jgi:hypothetical protein
VTHMISENRVLSPALQLAPTQMEFPLLISSIRS